MAQPIVFQRLKDGSMIVVDGQQRLTTIAIIRYVLEDERISDMQIAVSYRKVYNMNQ